MNSQQMLQMPEVAHTTLKANIYVHSMLQSGNGHLTHITATHLFPDPM